VFMHATALYSRLRIVPRTHHTTLRVAAEGRNISLDFGPRLGREDGGSYKHPQWGPSSAGFCPPPRRFFYAPFGTFPLLFLPPTSLSFFPPPSPLSFFLPPLFPLLFLPRGFSPPPLPFFLFPPPLFSPPPPFWYSFPPLPPGWPEARRGNGAEDALRGALYRG